MTRPQGSYNSAQVLEFYASYTSTIYLITPLEGRGVEHPQLAYILVKRVRVDSPEIAMPSII